MDSRTGTTMHLHLRRFTSALLAVTLLAGACTPAAPPAPTAAPAAGKADAPKTEAAKPTMPVAAAATAGPQAAAAAPAPAAGVKQELVYVEGTDVVTLDGGFVSDIPSQALLLLVFDNLVKLSPRMEIMPGAAQSWDVSEDKKTWTFKLRPGMKFSNGNPLNARAVKFTIDRILDKAGAAAIA